MSQITKDPNAFQLDDLNLSNIGSITIKDVSEGRSQGRRFKLVFAGKESDELVFHDIFKQVQKLARKEKNFENLKTITDFLNTIQDAEKIAADKYTVEADKDFGYRFNTGLHRFFDIGSWGSHSTRIDALKDKITKRNTDLQTTFNDLDLISDETEKNQKAEDLVDEYLKGNNIDNALHTILAKMTPSVARDHALKSVIKKCEPKKGVEITKAETFFNPSVKHNILSDYARNFLNNGDLDNAFSVIEDLDRDDLKTQLFKKFIIKNELDKAFEIFYKISADHMRDFALQNIAKGYSNRGLARSIQEINSSNIPEKEKETLLTEITSFNIQKNDPGTALEIVQNSDLPMRTKNVLLENIITKSCEGDDAQDVINKILRLRTQITRLHTSSNENKDMFLEGLIIHICKDLDQYDLVKGIAMHMSDDLTEELQSKIANKSF